MKRLFSSTLSPSPAAAEDELQGKRLAMRGADYAKLFEATPFPVGGRQSDASDGKSKDF